MVLTYAGIGLQARCAGPALDIWCVWQLLDLK